MSSMEELFGEVIHTYSRAQALEDGALVEAPAEVSREAGFRFPVTLSRNVYERCVAWNNDDEEQYQDESGRLWDVLWMARNAALRPGTRDKGLVEFQVLVVPRGAPAGEPKPELVDLWLHIGPGDTPEPVLTIMFPEDY